MPMGVNGLLQVPQFTTRLGVRQHLSRSMHMLQQSEAQSISAAASASMPSPLRVLPLGPNYTSTACSEGLMAASA